MDTLEQFSAYMIGLPSAIRAHAAREPQRCGESRLHSRSSVTVHRHWRGLSQEITWHARFPRSGSRGHDEHDSAHRPRRLGALIALIALGGCEPRVRATGEHPVIVSHLSKYRSLLPALALLYHLASGPTASRVGEEAVLTGKLWVQYLESHARRIYAPVAGTDTAPAEALAQLIREGALEDGFSLRDVYRPQWSGLTSREDAESAVEELVELVWLRIEEQATGGRARTVHRINPRLEVRR